VLKTTLKKNSVIS